MAIVACRECAHQVSDAAASCPNCGAPVAGATKARSRAKQILYGILITFAALWMIGTTLWTIGTLDTFDQVIRSIRAPDRPSGPSRYQAPASGTTTEAPRVVYQTTAEQLYRDYAANEVATQTKIGGSRVSVSGSVAEIDEDAGGRPVVRLRTDGAGSADMILARDQTADAAQLVKGETVDIQCDRMQRKGASPRGSDCVLVLIDAAATEEPVPGTAALQAPAGADARETPAPAMSPAARAAAKPVAKPAHERRHRARVEHRAKAAHPAAAVARAVRKPAPSAVPVAVPLAAPVAAPPAAPAAAASAARASVAAARAPAALDLSLTPVAAQALVDPQGQEDMAAHANPAMAEPSSTREPKARAPASGAADDLAAVRAVDPQAAAHIASYCTSSTAAASDRAGVAASCRRDEVAAWRRLVIHNEFPALDDATRRKCDGPPFPDSYVAKELCAKYELHMD